jgi:hypothetical protein
MANASDLEDKQFYLQYQSVPGQYGDYNLLCTVNNGTIGLHGSSIDGYGETPPAGAIKFRMIQDRKVQGAFLLDFGDYNVVNSNTIGLEGAAGRGIVFYLSNLQYFPNDNFYTCNLLIDDMSQCIISNSAHGLVATPYDGTSKLKSFVLAPV